jgi:hypothetical protein
VTSRLAYVGDDGRIVEAWVGDMAELADRAHVPGHGSLAPVSVYPDGAGGAGEGEPHASVDIGLSSDVWFPWNPAGHRRVAEPIDNRALARLNGGRLNEFLAVARATALELGGGWSWPRHKASRLRPAGEHGVLLDD